MSSWRKNFPPNVETDDNAKLFLSRMNYIAIASMLVHRGVVPMNIVRKRHVRDVMFYMFDSKTPWGKKLHEMMMGIQDGILKKYVREVQVVFGKSNEHPDEIIEKFAIKFSYDEQDAIEITDGAGKPVVKLGYRGMEAFKMQVLDLLLRILNVAGALRKLPVVVPNMQITYYQHAPEDYQCPMFPPCDELYGFKQPVEAFAVGRLETNYGSMFLGVESLLVPKANLPALVKKVDKSVAEQLREKLNQSSDMDTSVVECENNTLDLSVAILPVASHEPEAPTSAKKIMKTPPGKRTETRQSRSADIGTSLTTASQAYASESEDVPQKSTNSRRRQSKDKLELETPKKTPRRGRVTKSPSSKSSAQDSSGSNNTAKRMLVPPVARPRRTRESLFSESRHSRRFVLPTPEADVASD